MPPNAPTKADVLDRYERHELSDAQVQRSEIIRAAVRSLAHKILEHTGPSREQSLALTHLEETLMWATKSIALEGA